MNRVFDILLFCVIASATVIRGIYHAPIGGARVLSDDKGLVPGTYHADASRNAPFNTEIIVHADHTVSYHIYMANGRELTKKEEKFEYTVTHNGQVVVHISAEKYASTFKAFNECFFFMASQSSFQFMLFVVEGYEGLAQIGLDLANGLHLSLANQDRRSLTSTSESTSSFVHVEEVVAGSYEAHFRFFDVVVTLTANHKVSYSVTMKDGTQLVQKGVEFDYTLSADGDILVKAEGSYFETVFREYNACFGFTETVQQFTRLSYVSVPGVGSSVGLSLLGGARVLSDDKGLVPGTYHADASRNAPFNTEIIVHADHTVSYHIYMANGRELTKKEDKFEYTITHNGQVVVHISAEKYASTFKAFNECFFFMASQSSFQFMLFVVEGYEGLAQIGLDLANGLHLSLANQDRRSLTSTSESTPSFVHVEEVVAGSYEAHFRFFDVVVTLTANHKVSYSVTMKDGTQLVQKGVEFDYTLSADGDILVKAEGSYFETVFREYNACFGFTETVKQFTRLSYVSVPGVGSSVGLSLLGEHQSLTVTRHD
ncbi:hypothetical protein FOL47_005658 [Perkinsus chesapeaki]|uniref:Uncharacterized protein n=2 Tax=Alveolata TaxID=33630 RepID=A0A7J6LWJ4_PERCH|nr:hypothetical protein FOL47_005658 [Perkinsus chesapeaki]